MAATAPSTDQLPLLHNPTSQPSTSPPPFSPLPPDYYAPPTPTSRSQSQVQTSPQRSVRFQSPPADRPRSAPDNHSLLPPYTPRKRAYKGHRSEAEYLAALRAWAVDKDTMQSTDKCELPGFYGKETMEECILKNPKLRDGRRKRERKGEGNALRVEEVMREGEGEGDTDEEGKVPKLEVTERADIVEPRRRKSSFGQWLSRKRTR